METKKTNNNEDIDKFLKLDIIKDCIREKNFSEKNFEKYVYLGIDPTKNEIHIGNYALLNSLKRICRLGFKGLIVIGDYTARVGDPSGKAKERFLLEENIIDKNSDEIELFIKKYFPEFKIVRNSQWLESIKYIEFLREYGKYFSIGEMIKRQIIADRIKSGISYSEFSYMLVQAVDFIYVNKQYDCIGQIGGSDQWGNILSGIQLADKKDPNNCFFGITFKLLVDKSGKKFGKSENNSILLNENINNAFSLYQFFFNIPDLYIEIFMFYFTVKSQEDIKNNITNNKEKNKLQSNLASDFIKTHYNENILNTVLKLKKILFSKRITEKYSSHEFKKIISVHKIYKIKNNDELYSILIKYNICKSRREIRDFIVQKSLSANWNTIVEDKKIKEINLYYKEYLIIKKSKKFFYIFKVDN